jgi:hypothetical protein
MPVALVQEADAASSSVTLSATTAGNTLVVAVACLGPTSATGVTGITLGGSPDNFTLIAPGPSARDATSPNDYLNVSVWADANCASGTAAVVTGTGVQAVWAFEFSGLAGVADIAQVFFVGTYQDCWLAATAQTTVPAEAWIAVIGAANQTAAPGASVTSGNGWTTETAHSGTSGGYDWGAVAAYQTVNTAGVPSFGGSFSQASFSAVAIVTLGAGTPPAAVTAKAPLPGNVTVSGDVAAQGAVHSAGVITQGGTPVGLTPVGPKTGSYAPNPGELVLTDYSKGPALPVITLPAAPANGALAGVKLLTNPSGLLTVQASGTDVIDAPATTQIFPSGTGTVFVLQYKTSTGTWYTQSTGTQLPGPPALNSPQPSDAGLVTWPYDYAALAGPLTGVALPAGGVVTLIRCPVRATAQVSTILHWVTAAGSGLTSGQNFAGVYASTGTLLGSTADLTSAWGGTGEMTPGIASAPVTISPPFIWAAFLCNGTTGPSLACTASVSAAWANLHTVSSQYRFGRINAGGNTSLPSSFNPATGIGSSATEYFTGLY